MSTVECEEASPSLADVIVADHCHLRIPSQPERISSTVDLLVQRAQQAGAIPPGKEMRLMMALHEALTNSIIHGNLGISSALKEQGDEEFFQAVGQRLSDPAYAGRLVDIRASYSEGAARWIFTDQGAGFDADSALRRLDSDQEDPSKPSGRGLVLIRAFTDEMRYEDRGRRLILTLRKNPARENRGQQRVRLPGTVHVAPVDGSGAVHHEAGREAPARNISAEGIAFLQSEQVSPGQVMITIPTRGEPISIPAEVRHWHTLGDQVVEVGCRFTAPVQLTAGDAATSEQLSAVHQLVDRMAEELRPELERRSAPRLPYSERISIQTADGKTQAGFARDLSRAGIAFFATSNLPLERILLTLPDGSAETTIQVSARIVRCTRLVDDFYDVAAQFTA